MVTTVRLVVLMAIAALGSPLAASAETIELGWRESDGAGVMSFRVQSLTLARRGWDVRASFTNTSSVPLRIDRRHPNGFSLRAHFTRSYRSPHVKLAASRFRPGLPTVLAPGRTGNGTFGGSGRPPRLTFVRVLFGRFSGSPPQLPRFRFSWLTEHYYRLR